MSFYRDCDECLDGSVWEINDSKRRFVVVGTTHQYVVVENVEPPARRRRILRRSLRTSQAKHGYTRITPSPYPKASTASRTENVDSP